MVADLGFEPRQTESESVVLPLHKSAIFVSYGGDVCHTNAIQIDNTLVLYNSVNRLSIFYLFLYLICDIIIAWR